MRILKQCVRQTSFQHSWKFRTKLYKEIKGKSTSTDWESSRTWYTGQPQYIAVPESNKAKQRHSRLCYCSAEFYVDLWKTLHWVNQGPTADVSLKWPIGMPDKADIGLRIFCSNMDVGARDPCTLYPITWCTGALILKLTCSAWTPLYTVPVAAWMLGVISDYWHNLFVDWQNDSTACKYKQKLSLQYVK